MAKTYVPTVDAFELHHRIREQASLQSSRGQLKHILHSAKDGLAGSTGAAISNVVTYPLDLIITRLQIQRQFRKNAQQSSEEEYSGLVDAAQKIYAKAGLRGFFAGVASDTGKTLADGFIFFMLYDYLRRARLHRHGNVKSLPALEELSVGFVAGATTKLLTTPIANVVTRQQAAALRTPNEKTPSAASIITSIRRDQGFSGFWSGYSASLVLTLNPSLTFFLFEFFKRAILPRSQRDNPPTSLTFILAALSKAFASSVTYPFSLTKARLQAGAVQTRQAQHKEDDEVNRTVEKDDKTGNDQVKELEKKAIRKTLLSTMLTIYQSEGPTALYEGLYLEVLKGFVSHGITMSVKQSIAHLISRVTYTLSLIFSNPQQTARRASRLAERAKDKSVGYYDLSIKRVNEKVQEATDAAKSTVHEVAEFVSEYVGDEENAEAKELYGMTGLSKWLDTRFDDDKE